MTLRLLRLVSVPCLLASASLRAQPPASAVPGTPPMANDMMTIKLPDTDIDTMLNTLKELTGKEILRPSALPPATFNLMITRPMAKADIIVAIETELALNGIGVSPLDNKFLKIVPLQNMRTEAPEMITGSALDVPPSGRIATKIFMLDFLRVNEFVQQIGGLLSIGTGGPQSVVQLPSANAALITDSVSNLQRIEVLLSQVDRPVTASIKPKFYSLRNGAKASDVVAKIRATIGQQLQLQLGNATTYSADDRSNQIILIADPRQHAFFDELIEKLDVKSDPITRNEVIPLKHAVSKEVQPILQNLVTGQNNAAARATQSVRPGQGVQGNLPPGMTPTNPVAANAPGAAPGAQPAPQAPSTAALNLAGSNLEVSGTNEFSALIGIQSDDRSNAIVVTGTVDDIRIIRELIAKLDVLLAQVRIEVIIAEVTLSNTDKSGISALNLTVGTDTPATGDNGRGTHITNFGPVGVAGWTVTEGIVNPLAFKAALDAAGAGSRSNLRVLQAPAIVTAHAKEGRIIVGSEVPYVSSATSSLTTGTTGDVTNQSVSFKDINLDLKVTPLIGEDGSIQLTIDQIIKDQIDTVTINGNPTPVIGSRQATSFVNVYDGQMIVLGGLQRTSLNNSRNKIGFIYEIPILSQLLGARTSSTARTELLLFVRPHVMRPETGTADTQQTIDTLSNKDQINQYLKDPSKTPKQSLFEKLK